MESDEEYIPEAGRKRASARAGRAGGINSFRPERQPTRWEADLYKPFWTRGYGKAKEGWCGICDPGVWLKTKTSVYWYVILILNNYYYYTSIEFLRYHMHNFHGISSIAGDFFTPPIRFRISDQTALREGLCHQCKKWIPVQGDKPVNVEEIYWFKHSQKCHRYPVQQDGENEDGADAMEC
jgi:hypothetical protein